VLLEGEGRLQEEPHRLLVVQEAFDLLPEAYRADLEERAREVADLLGASIQETSFHREDIEEWYAAFRHIQAREIWQVHGEWITACRPRFGPGIRERFEAARELARTHDRRDEDEAQRVRLRERLAALLPAGALLCLPPAADIAPPVAAETAHLERLRDRNLRLTCIAALAGLPQLSMPLGRGGECPLGLSLAVGQGGDELLLDVAVRCAPLSVF
jgi:amidase